jgi:Cu/Ag efflux protein CusF
VVAAVGIWLLFVLVFTTLVAAQAPAPGAKAPAVAKSEVSGKIKSVDPAGRTVLLENGTRLMIPESVHVDTATLKPGATVKASVEDKGGQKVVTAIQVN